MPSGSEPMRRKPSTSRAVPSRSTLSLVLPASRRVSHCRPRRPEHMAPSSSSLVYERKAKLQQPSRRAEPRPRLPGRSSPRSAPPVASASPRSQARREPAASTTPATHRLPSRSARLSEEARPSTTRPGSSWQPPSAANPTRRASLAYFHSTAEQSPTEASACSRAHSTWAPSGSRVAVSTLAPSMDSKSRALSATADGPPFTVASMRRISRKGRRSRLRSWRS
mmetsp:Transcript_86146/g.257087  ORF Transcript_86146/g.257087 Transcript_86146/m.257087 type:complete len:224 (-) Transcript_86146:108-779(-)